MFESGKLRKFKLCAKYLLLLFVLIITLTYHTMNDDLTRASDALKQVLKKPNVPPQIEDSSNEKPKPSSESKGNYPEAELDIKVTLSRMRKKD